MRSPAKAAPALARPAPCVSDLEGWERAELIRRAREVIVGTLGTIYGVEDGEDEGRGLPGPGRRRSPDVATVEDRRDGRFLDGRRGLEEVFSSQVGRGRQHRPGLGADPSRLRGDGVAALQTDDVVPLASESLLFP